MKKQIILLTNLFLFLGSLALNAQDAQQECNIKYNLFKGDYQSKKYEDAYPNWIYLMDNCKKLSINVYKLGDKLAQVRFKNAENKTEAAALVKRVYLQRLENFPTIDPAKAHSNYATFLIKNKLASDEEVFEILQLAYSYRSYSHERKKYLQIFSGDY